MGSINHRVVRGSRILVALAAAGWCATCSSVSPPILETDVAASSRVPVVFVPGVTGVGLSDKATRKLVWGKGWNLIRPHDRGHGMARTLSGSHLGPQLEPAGAILDLRLFGIVRYSIYQELVDLFVANGYSHGDLQSPQPTDDFFLFSYDWRQDNVSSAAHLAEQLASLRRVRGQENLEVDLICQSNGAHICRYFAKYGGADLAVAEAENSPAAAGLSVRQLILVGTSNGGSIRVLRELNRGRRYVDLIGRLWSPETLFTFESLYQDLPSYTTDLFVDESGEPMAVDLFDVENWRRFQWSIYGQQASRVLARDDLPPWFGSAAERERFLVSALDRARRFHTLLRQDVPDFGSTRYFLISNTGNETSSRAVLSEDKGAWTTRFEDDKTVRRDPTLRSALVEAGDGHATATSQRWLSPQERKRLGENVVEVEGTHRRVILQEATHERILKILAEDVPQNE